MPEESAAVYWTKWSNVKFWVEMVHDQRSMKLIEYHHSSPHLHIVIQAQVCSVPSAEESKALRQCNALACKACIPGEVEEVEKTAYEDELGLKFLRRLS